MPAVGLPAMLRHRLRLRRRGSRPISSLVRNRIAGIGRPASRCSLQIGARGDVSVPPCEIIGDRSNAVELMRGEGYRRGCAAGNEGVLKPARRRTSRWNLVRKMSMPLGNVPPTRARLDPIQPIERMLALGRTPSGASPSCLDLDLILCLMLKVIGAEAGVASSAEAPLRAAGRP